METTPATPDNLRDGIRSSLTEPEAWNLANELLETIKACGLYEFSSGVGTLPVFPIPVIFGIAIRAATPDLAKANTLRDALKKIDISDVTVELTKTTESGELSITVGPRP